MVNRYQKAKWAEGISGPVFYLLIIFSVVLLTIGFVAVLFDYMFGFILMGFSVYPVMISEWYKRELKEVPIDTNDQTLFGLCDSKLLGKLPPNPSPLDLANAINKTPGSSFFEKRFGIANEALSSIASDSPDDMSKVWQVALEVMHDTASEYASLEVLIVAIIKSYQNNELLIAPLLLNIDDLYAGIRWKNHLVKLSEKPKVHKRSGGLGRDWSFGWTPKLNQFGQNLSLSSYALPTVDLSSREIVLAQMDKILSSSTKRNVALIGKTGTGKTAILRNFGDRLMDASSKVDESLLYRQLILLDASYILSHGGQRGEIEFLLNEIFVEAYASKNIIIGLDNAHLFFEEGVGSINASNLVKPILEHGGLPVVMVFSDEKFTQLIAKDPELSTLLNRVVINPPDENESMIIMQDAILQYEYDRKVTYMYQALKEAYRAGLRYVSSASMPAQAVMLLDAAANHAKNGLVTAESVRQSVESTFGVKMGVVDSKQEKEVLLNLESLIHERMINQTHAVSAVSDSLRRARTGLSSEHKPVGTFLFIGPTGVGKTELAKALAEVYYGGEDRLIRVDLNEYVTEKDVLRLIEDAASNPVSLTAQISRQPFSVVLLDEIEKAHPKVLSTLLQMLDEGILVDEKNHPVSFRDAIIIATSNAGADRVREYIARGLDVIKMQKSFVDELINQRIFMPEFLNRFDEIVMFTPLSEDDLKKVAVNILKSINKNMSSQKINIELSNEALEYLVKKGNDPVFGARPMRRVMQRAVENIVAKEVLSGRVKPGETILIGYEDIVGLIK